MYDFLLALHLVLAVFAVGPLVHAATTAGRGIRTGNGTSTASSARTLRLYGYASVLVVIVGFALLSLDSPYGPGKVGEVGQVWVWLSLVLWLVAVGIVLGELVPRLEKISGLIEAQQSVVAMTGRVAAAGGVVGLLLVAVVVLMVYRPGQ